MRRAARSAGGIVDLPRSRLRQRYQFFDIARWQEAMRYQHKGRRRCHGNRCEIPHGVVGQLRIHAGIYRVRAGHKQQCVTIGRRMRDVLASHDAIGPCAIVHHDLPRERFGHARRQVPRDHVRAAPRCERHHHAYRFCRVTLCKRCVTAATRYDRSSGDSGRASACVKTIRHSC